MLHKIFLKKEPKWQMVGNIGRIYIRCNVSMDVRVYNLNAKSGQFRNDQTAISTYVNIFYANDAFMLLLAYEFAYRVLDIEDIAHRRISFSSNVKVSEYRWIHANSIIPTNRSMDKFAKRLEAPDVAGTSGNSSADYVVRTTYRSFPRCSPS